MSLDRVVLDGDNIDHGRWMLACASGTSVGECGVCGGLLQPERPRDRGGGRFDYNAVCAGCGQEVLAPGGRTLRRSGQHNEMPGGWWEHRVQQLKTT